MTPERYAIYVVPDERAPWAQAATSWLGWDMITGRSVPHPSLPGLQDRVSALTAVPRRYGLHATIKPPFRLAPGKTRQALERAVEGLARTQSAVILDGLSLMPLGRFLALTIDGDAAPLNALAARTVRDLDGFRGKATAQELERRRSARLTPKQEEHLTRWGYPYVMDAFRFHITLTGKLPKEDLNSAYAALDRFLGPLLPQPFTIGDLALVGEDSDGVFHLLRRFPLSGAD